MNAGKLYGEGSATKGVESRDGWGEAIGVGWCWQGIGSWQRSVYSY